MAQGVYAHFEKQFLSTLHLDKKCLKNLFLFPTSGARFYRCENGAWVQVYEYKLSPQEQEKIITAFEDAFKKIDYTQPAKTWGKNFENRGTQITFSALGQEAPIEKKQNGIKQVIDAKNYWLYLKKASQNLKLELEG